MELLQVSPEATCQCHDPSAPGTGGDITRGNPLILATRYLAIVHDWRDVLLCLPDRDPLSVGTHYDEARAVKVAPSGLWCASGGCGVLIYFLRNPSHPFCSGVASDQWWEIGRDEDDPWPVTVCGSSATTAFGSLSIRSRPTAAFTP